MKIDKVFQLFTLLSDIIVIPSTFYLAFYMRFYSNLFTVPLGIPPLLPYLKAIIFITTTWVILFYLLGMYKPKVSYSYLDELYSCTIAVSLGILINMSVTFLYREFSYSRLVMGISFFLTIFTLSITRYFINLLKQELLKKGIGVKNTIILASGDSLDKIITNISANPSFGYNIIGFINDEEDIPERYNIKRLGNKNDIKDIIKKEQVDEIIMSLSSYTQQDILDVILSIDNENVKFSIIPDMLGVITSRVDISNLKGLQIMHLKEIPLRGINKILKRIFDIIIASILLIIVSPLLLFIAILIKYSKWSTKGSVIFKQERVGEGGKVFTFYKFRTMIEDAEHETGPVWAKEDDKRVTKIGKYLRKTSLDELPQLVNVLKGDMSLVGPRPERPYFVEKFQTRIQQYMRRHKVKPGLTGWAQVNGLRGDTDIYERTKYDLYYIENWSLLFDIKILLKTAVEFLFHRTAY